jgi:AmmeMemoRadiSam system protein B
VHTASAALKWRRNLWRRSLLPHPIHGASTSTASPPPLRATICLHAGYSYSGPTAVFSYYHLQHKLEKPNSPLQHILVLHPSHHFYSGATYLETPLGDLQVDEELGLERLDLRNTNINAVAFSIMEQGVEEWEHSGEMQYPYIAKAAASSSNSIKVLPLMCGNLSSQQQEDYGGRRFSVVGTFSSGSR